MLRLDLHKEWISSDTVSHLLVAVNFVCTPAPLLYDLVGRSWAVTQTFACDQNTISELLGSQQSEDALWGGGGGGGGGDGGGGDGNGGDGGGAT